MEVVNQCFMYLLQCRCAGDRGAWYIKQTIAGSHLIALGSGGTDGFYHGLSLVISHVKLPHDAPLGNLALGYKALNKSYK